MAPAVEPDSNHRVVLVVLVGLAYALLLIKLALRPAILGELQPAPANCGERPKAPTHFGAIPALIALSSSVLPQALSTRTYPATSWEVSPCKHTQKRRTNDSVLQNKPSIIKNIKIII